MLSVGQSQLPITAKCRLSICFKLRRLSLKPHSWKALKVSLGFVCRLSLLDEAGTKAWQCIGRQSRKYPRLSNLGTLGSLFYLMMLFRRRRMPESARRVVRQFAALAAAVLCMTNPLHQACSRSCPCILHKWKLVAVTECSEPVGGHTSRWLKASMATSELT